MSKNGRTVERTQTGVRIEKRILKILKAVAAHQEISLGDLIENIVLHNFEGKQPFDAETLAFIKAMRDAYGLDLTATESPQLVNA